MDSSEHEYWMALALEQAEKARAIDEVPVGAIVVRDGEVIGEGYNQPISINDPSAHAEIMALRNAAQRVNNYRLPGSTLYVTLEPCTMCFGAMIHARVESLVFGACEPKAGVVCSADQIVKKDYFNHRIKVVKGILESRCGGMLSDFFKARRAQIKKANP
ncbi:tRNA adenosine(34) deaminase TadA [Gynuella sp.]|uniref:tRNA adenosine(34) deaminase TadA n=1 Tax=Gynuella sp. TaxID=2969146 RepID=UPI003D09F5B0